jgi:flagellar basal-body rod protein FlgF
MNYGLYTAYLGMRARMRSVEAIANNLSNASTTGFKADKLYYRSVESYALDATSQRDPFAETTPQTEADLQVRTLGVTAGGTADFSNGALRETGRALDVGLNGDGFLVVQTARGERYTRNGALALDATGQLVTAQGDLIVGTGGPITLPPGEVSITESGNISVAGRPVAQLKVVRFPDARADLLKEGDALFVSRSEQPPLEATGTRVEQGMLEASNVNPVGELVAMIQNNREFESLQRSITLQGSLRKIAGEIGKI